jgi:hypothetical protein
LEKGTTPKDLLPLPGDEIGIEKIDMEAEKKKLEENKDWFKKLPE